MDTMDDMDDEKRPYSETERNQQQSANKRPIAIRSILQIVPILNETLTGFTVQHIGDVSRIQDYLLNPDKRSKSAVYVYTRQPLQHHFLAADALVIWRDETVSITWNETTTDQLRDQLKRDQTNLEKSLVCQMQSDYSIHSNKPHNATATAAMVSSNVYWMKRFSEMCKIQQQMKNAMAATEKELRQWKGDANEIKKVEIAVLQKMKQTMEQTLEHIQERYEAETRCGICLTEQKTVCMLPCKHALCKTCVYKVHECPLCRCRIENRVRI